LIWANVGCLDFRFTNPLFHPNVYPDGRLCISILHPPGDDEMSGESAAIRWSPAQRAESVLISVLSLLDDANVDSPANVDASVMFRNNRNSYEEKVATDLERSKKDIPEGFVLPTAAAAYGVKRPDAVALDDDWGDSDAEFDFDDSDADDEDIMEVDGAESDEDEDDQDS
jgi:ubiquitin-conjugating enzyme E2 R